MSAADLRTIEMEERAMRWQRKLTLWSGAVMLPFFVEDLVLGGPSVGWSIGIKALWGIGLIAVGLSLPRLTPAGRSRLVALTAVQCGVAMTAIAWLRGDAHTPFFAWLFALPFCMLAMVRDDVRAAAACAVTSSVGAIAILLRGGVGPTELTQWILCLASSSGLVVYASLHLRGQREEELRLNRERLEAIERLADSEKRTAHAQRMATIGTLAAGVAHEINNPLAAVSSNLDFLETEVTNPTAPLEELTLVVLEAQVALKRIKGIVGDLSVFSRESAAGEAKVDLKAVVDEAERMAAQRTGHQIGIQSHLPANLPQVMGNPKHLAQVFLNLLINSADAIGETARTDGQIWIRATNAGEAVTIDIEDNGPGLSDGVLKGLFVPFFTTRAPKRTGLGLATSREYLRRAGGDLTAAARPEGGARFTIALRAAP